MRIVLRRGALARAVGDAWYQPILAFLFVLYLAITILVGVVTSSFSVLGVVPGIVVLALWLLGATGTAAVDDAGIHWRLALPRSVPWERVGSVEFGGAIARGTLSAGQAAIRVHATGGIGHSGAVVGPVLGTSDADRLAFGAALADAARRHGVPVEVRIPDNWPDLQ